MAKRRRLRILILLLFAALITSVGIVSADPIDDDGDGYCDDVACSDGSIAGDCDDTNPSVNPSAIEVCDTVDNDCDGAIDEFFYRCGNPFHCPSPELCNTIDDDCDGSVDEDWICGTCTPGEEICDRCDNDCDGVADNPPPGGFADPCEPPGFVAIGECLPGGPAPRLVTLAVLGDHWGSGDLAGLVSFSYGSSPSVALRPDVHKRLQVSSVNQVFDSTQPFADDHFLSDVDLWVDGAGGPRVLAPTVGGQRFLVGVTSESSGVQFEEGAPIVLDVSAEVGVPGATLTVTPQPGGTSGTLHPAALTAELVLTIPTTAVPIAGPVSIVGLACLLAIALAWRLLRARRAN